MELTITYELPKVHPLEFMSFERDLSKIKLQLKHLRSPILLDKWYISDQFCSKFHINALSSKTMI